MTGDRRRDDQPETAEELVEKHGRKRIESLAADGNITAGVVLDIVDEEDSQR